MLSLIPIVLICAGLGAAWARFSRCSTGACSLAGNWKRGASFGAVLGLGFYLVTGDAMEPYQPPKNARAITAVQFDAEVTQAGRPVVVDFYATWCGSCKRMAPRLDTVAGEYSNSVKFVQVNFDDAAALAERLNVPGVPTLLFFNKQGHLVDAVVGLVSVETLRAKLSALAGT
jgi:thioredoxin 1